MAGAVGNDPTSQAFQASANQSQLYPDNIMLTVSLELTALFKVVNDF